MKPNTRYLLSVNDEISFPGVEPHSFRVLSLLPPERSLTLIPIASTELTSEIVIDYALLPNEQEAEVAIYFEPKTERWIANYCTEAAEQCLQLRDGDQICFRGLEWRVSIVETQAKTVAVSPDLVTCADLNFRFELSLDEENTHLLIDTQDKQFDLKIFAHHYLTANLARYRAADAARGIGSDDQGWVDVERLGKDLGLNNTHLNIQIHRARKQFQNTLMTFDTDFLIQRVPGKVRFGGEKMSLLKGGKLECSIDNLCLKSA